MQIKEVVKYVEKYIEAKCTQCEEVAAQVTSLKDTVSSLEAAKASLLEKAESEKKELLSQLETVDVELSRAKTTS